MNHALKTGLVAAVVFILPLLATSCADEYAEDLTAAAEQATRAQSLTATAEAGWLARGATFWCYPPQSSYVHREMDIDLDYEESWDYSIHINANNDTFQLDHEAYSNRRLEGDLCDDIFVWRAQQSGEVDEEHRLNTTITLNQRNTFICDAHEAGPASEETREDVFQWWVISNPPFSDTNGALRINVCTCNANAHQLTPEDVAEFHRTGVCPPCIPGAMLCTAAEQSR